MMFVLVFFWITSRGSTYGATASRLDSQPWSIIDASQKCPTDYLPPPA